MIGRVCRAKGAQQVDPVAGPDDREVSGLDIGSQTHGRQRGGQKAHGDEHWGLSVLQLMPPSLRKRR
jgi:hypothetical protein